ncbi:MAG: hypothetical protein ACYSYT_11230 [Planctomycetota bacterium]
MRTQRVVQVIEACSDSDFVPVECVVIPEDGFGDGGPASIAAVESAAETGISVQVSECSGGGVAGDGAVCN